MYSANYLAYQRHCPEVCQIIDQLHKELTREERNRLRNTVGSIPHINIIDGEPVFAFLHALKVFRRHCPDRAQLLVELHRKAFALNPSLVEEGVKSLNDINT